MRVRQYRSWFLRLLSAIVLLFAISPITLAHSPELREATVPLSEPPPARARSAATVPAPASHPAQKSGYSIPYTVRPGDTLGTVAAMFGVTADDLARANHMEPDDELMADEVLRVPNPFTAELNALKGQVDSLNAEAVTAERKTEVAHNQLRAAQSQAQDLTADNRVLRQGLRMMPWWRGTALAAGAAAVLMFGLMLLAAFEWWRMRQRFIALVDMTDTLGRLDYKYKSMVAKAELRLQQIYGRRRAGIAAEGQPPPRPKTPEELEIERLNGELKEILEENLERLGARRGGARARWRELLGSVSAPAEARSARR